MQKSLKKTPLAKKYYVNTNGKLVELRVKPSTIFRNGYSLFYVKSDAYLDYLDRLSERIRRVEQDLERGLL